VHTWLDIAQENNSLEALQHFETELMPLVVINVGIVSSDTALQSVLDLKGKCTFTYSGFKVPNACWELDKQIEAFYKTLTWLDPDIFVMKILKEHIGKLTNANRPGEELTKEVMKND
jgi:hypothetical protein